jgi:hypothetical protein
MLGGMPTSGLVQTITCGIAVFLNKQGNMLLVDVAELQAKLELHGDILQSE